MCIERPIHQHTAFYVYSVAGSKTRTIFRFHEELESLKKRLLRSHPDEPVVLHREGMINTRKAFSPLRDASLRASFDNEFLHAVAAAKFRIVAVVIDKQRLKELYGEAAEHPYHLAMGFLMQRFAEYLNHINRTGDILAESRGGKEDKLLKKVYADIFEQGVWQTEAHAFQSALTTKNLKLKPKSANIAGLQLADILGHPVKQSILRDKGHIDRTPTIFAESLIQALKNKFNCHIENEQIEDYGTVLFPKN